MGWEASRGLGIKEGGRKGFLSHEESTAGRYFNETFRYIVVGHLHIGR